jgi:hypothetical protein
MRHARRECRKAPSVLADSVTWIASRNCLTPLGIQAQPVGVRGVPSTTRKCLPGGHVASVAFSEA